jgi:hypothetical protein
MPSADIFQRAVRKPCYFNLGTFQNDPTTQKHVRASFDIVRIDGQWYIQPVTTPVAKGSGKVNPDAAVFAETGDNFYRAQEEFYTDGSFIVLGEYEMGDYKGRQDNWKECFKLGKI